MLKQEIFAYTLLIPCCCSRSLTVHTDRRVQSHCANSASSRSSTTTKHHKHPQGSTETEVQLPKLSVLLQNRRASLSLLCMREQVREREGNVCVCMCVWVCVCFLQSRGLSLSWLPCDRLSCRVFTQISSTILPPGSRDFPSPPFCLPPPFLPPSSVCVFLHLTAFSVVTLFKGEFVTDCSDFPPDIFIHSCRLLLFYSCNKSTTSTQSLTLVLVLFLQR